MERVHCFPIHVFALDPGFVGQEGQGWFWLTHKKTTEKVILKGGC